MAAPPNKRHRWDPNPDAVAPDVDLPERNEHGNMPRPPDNVVAALVHYEQDKRGREVCGAWRPKKGGVCCKWPKRGRNRCGDCGGNSLRGIEHPNFSVGIFSDAIKGQPSVQADYHRLLNDKRLMDMREHVAVSTQQLKALYSELVGQAPPMEQWQKLNALADKMEAAGSDAEALAVARQMTTAIRSGLDVLRKRKEFIKLQDHTRKLIDSERRHKLKERETMSREAFNVNMAILADAMKLFFERQAIMNFLRYVQKNVMDVNPEMVEDAKVIE